MKGSCRDQPALWEGGQGERCTIRAGGHYHRTGTHTTRQGSEVALQDKAQALHLRSCLTDAWR